MIDDKTLQRLLQGEVHRMNQELADPVPLRELVRETVPRTRTKSGKEHSFDPAALAAFAAALSPLLRATLQVPIRFYVSHEVPGECYAADADAIEALRQLGATTRAAREGRLWMSHALAERFAREHPTLVQFVRQ